VKALNFGNVTIDRVQDWYGALLPFADFYPAFNQEVLDSQRGWLEPNFLSARGSPREEWLHISLHSYVVRSGKNLILVDTCVGNDKHRTLIPDWVGHRTDYLGKLVAAGVKPEEVTHVMCTHLHLDHVGWNTKLQDGQWVPTFPNARYVFDRTEFESCAARPDAHVMDGSFTDSVLPIVEAGRADLVASDFALDDTVWLEPSRGHTAGHVCINVKGSKGQALMIGDSFHHPIQVAYPEWHTAYCIDKPASTVARRKILDKLCDQDIWMLAAHFNTPTAAHVVSSGGGRRLKAQAG
jgi:glyoxylase-like metal-dependent hydrolase (beta-lactamase superfamily II)